MDADQPKRKILDPMFGRGKELSDMLRAEFGVPPDAIWFEVRFARDEAVTVKCEFFPRARD